MIRRHRLWETFLYTHLNFGWDEIHEVAEELEHIRSKADPRTGIISGSPEDRPSWRCDPCSGFELPAGGQENLAADGSGCLLPNRSGTR